MTTRTPPITALWLGWTLMLVALVWFARSALWHRTESLLSVRHQQAVAISDDLQSAFLSLERLPQVLVSSVRDAADTATLSTAVLSDLRQQGAPFCRLYYLDEQGRPKGAGGDLRPPPEWLRHLVLRRLGSSRAVRTLRPLPPGFEVGRLSAQQLELEEETPPQYLAVAARTATGDIVLAELDLSYVFGHWLKKRLERTALGPGLTAHWPAVDPPLSPRPPLPNPASGAIWAPWEKRAWLWSCPTFFAASEHPFPPLELRLQQAEAIDSVQREWAWVAVLVALLMGALAWTIHRSARAVQRELAYAQAQSRFTAMAGHELRTPLAAISMYAEILREQLVDDPEKVAAYHQLLAGETERLQRLVENVLAFEKLESQHTEPAWESIVVGKVVERAVAIVGPLQAEIVVKSEAALPPITSDTAMLVQLLVNLLENAIKHAGREQPVEIALRRDGERVLIEVADRGRGIPREQQLEIFRPYTRVPNHSGPKKPGVGLGLAVVQRLADALGAKVWCRSREGGGTVFAVSLSAKEGNIT